MRLTYQFVIYRSSTTASVTDVTRELRSLTELDDERTHMTISRIPKDEPERPKDGCYYALMKLFLWVIFLGALLYGGLYLAFKYGDPSSF